MAAAIAVLAVFILGCSRLIKRTAPAAAPEHDSILKALGSRWALFGAASIFVYVGAEVTIGSMIPNFLHQHDLLDVTLEQGGKLLSLYWLGAMVGRFAGSAVLSRMRATTVLAGAALIASILCLVVNQGGGVAAAGCALAIGLFNSIMFPTIFTLTLERSTASAAATSGLLCMAIIGGAALPALAGKISDFFGAQNESAGMHAAFLLPMAAYAAISLFAMTAAKARVNAIGESAGHAAH
jgi:FHS family L-fucose permease-like MFS transporter